MYTNNFRSSDVVDVTAFNIAKTIKMRPCNIVLSYSNSFFHEHKELIESKILNLKKQGINVIVNIDNLIDTNLILQSGSDLCIVDKDYIPRTDCVVKFNQFLNFIKINGGNNVALTSNIEFIDESSKNNFYVCEKPEAYVSHYSEFNYFRGITYLPANLVNELLKYKKERSLCSDTICKFFREKFPKLYVYKLPIILVFTYCKQISEIDIKRIIFEQVSTPETVEVSESLKIVTLIPFKNNADLTVKCIRSLRKAWKNLDIFAINNNSNEDVIKQLELEDCNIINANVEYNYSLINNIGLSNINIENYQYILLLNNDVLVDPNAVKDMLSCFIDETIGAVGCKLKYPDGRLQFGGVGLSHKYRENNHLWYHIDQFKEESDCALSNFRQHSQSLTAACMLISQDAVKKCGLFNSDVFPIGFSDAYLALKLRKNGFNLLYTPNTSCVHYESVSRGYGYPDDLEGILLEKGSLMFNLPNLTWEVIHGSR